MTMLNSTLTRARDVQISPLGENTTVFRSRTWDRLKFEVEYALEKGTTANSYVIQGDKTALIDPPGESFTAIFLEHLQQFCDLSSLDYLILGHVNPNRMTTIKHLLEKNSQIKIICSKPASNVLHNTFPHLSEQIQSVRSDDTLDLGQGHQLKFIFAPTPRWVDGLLTYDAKTRILYTDKLFGVHLCGDSLFDEDWKQLDEDRRYYFDCLHAPQSKQVELILDKLESFGAKYYAPNHGVIVRYSLSRVFYDYRQWCQQQQNQSFKVALIYASAYGNTAIVAQAITQGLLENGIGVESLNCEFATPEEITQTLQECDGFIIGSPTLGGHAPVQIQTALGIILACVPKTQLAGVFGSFGWSGEAVDLLENKLKDANYRFGFEPIRVRFTPDETALKQCQAAGTKFAQNLKKQQKKTINHQGLTEAQIDRTEQAVGRIIGSLGVVTTYHNGQHQGFLTSWVSQATFSPPGIMMSIDKAQCLPENFVLNLLKQGRNVRKHFSYRGTNSENAFEQLKTDTATNGCLIITQALAYLECTVKQRIDAGDHWLIYATVDQGNVFDNEGITAIQRRKSGRQY